MNLTLIIAIIGCVTGLSSLLIQFISYFSTVARIEVVKDDASHSYFFDAIDFNVNSYRTRYSGVISLVISNKSSFPITINNIYIKNKKLKYPLKHDNEFKFTPKSIKLSTDTHTSYTYYTPSQIITLPLRLEAYDTVYASARFPFLDSLVDFDSLHTPIEFKLSVNTPRKTFTQKVK